MKILALACKCFRSSLVPWKIILIIKEMTKVKWVFMVFLVKWMKMMREFVCENGWFKSCDEMVRK